MQNYNYKKLWHNLRSSRIEHCSEMFSCNHNKIVVKAEHSLVSQGTEKLLLTQKLNGITYNKMKVPYLEGEFGTDFTYGYSLSGYILDGPTNVQNRKVHLMHPHQELAFVNLNDVVFIEDCDLKTASLASNVETALNAIWDSGFSIGENVLIIGYGMIGALLAAILKAGNPGELSIIEKDQNRLDLCVKHGFNAANNTINMSNEYDIIFNTTSSQEGLQLAIDNAGFESKIIELSWYGNTDLNLKLGDKFHYNRVKIISSQVSNLPPSKMGRWDPKRRKRMVFNILQTTDLAHLLTREVPFDQTPEFYDQLRNGKVNDIGVTIKY